MPHLHLVGLGFAPGNLAALAMETRRRALRQATSAQHSALDGLIGRPIDLQGYTHYLRTTTAFRASVEAEFDRAQPSPIGCTPLRLVDELVADCDDLQLSLNLEHRHVGLGNGVSSWLGATYVLEGACLGARVLMGDAMRLGLRDDFGARHLAKQTAFPDRWKEFLRQLEEAHEFDLEAATAAASRVFDTALYFAERP